MQSVKTISSELWPDIDIDAKTLNMNRSQFFDFLYRFYKTRSKNLLTFQHLILLLCLGLLCIILAVVI